jgi:hypothetical protein
MMPATRKMAPKLPPKQWTMTVTVTDAPDNGEDHLTEDEVIELVNLGDRPTGITVEISGVLDLTSKVKPSERNERAEKPPKVI